MPTLHQRRQSIWKRHDRALVTEQRILANDIGLYLLRQASATNEAGDRAIPPTREKLATISAAVWKRFLRPYFIGPGEEPMDGAKPLSPYTRMLVNGIEEAIRLEAKVQVALTRKTLRTYAPDILAYLVDGVDLPEDRFFELTIGPQFTPDDYRDPLTGKIDPVLAKKAFVKPKGTYDSYHKFVDAGGYTLSDRVWKSGMWERSAIDGFLAYHIPRGTSAVEIASGLEGFLTGDAAKAKTVKPYGTNGSYAARRLARTEITAAGGRACIAMSQANPMVGGIKWILSGAHGPEDADQCDLNAKGGPLGDGVYSTDKVPRYPDHPHCMCTLTPVQIGGLDIDEVTTLIRTEVRVERNKFVKGVTGETASGKAAAKLKKVLDPNILAKAAMDGTLQETIINQVKGFKPPKGYSIGKLLSPEDKKLEDYAVKITGLEERLKDKSLTPHAYGMVKKDIYYAKKAVSKLKKKMGIGPTPEQIARRKAAEAKKIADAKAAADAKAKELAKKKAAEELAKKKAELAKKMAAKKAKKAADELAKKKAESEKKAKELIAKITPIEKQIADAQGEIAVYKSIGDKKKVRSLQSKVSRLRKQIRDLGEIPKEGVTAPPVTPKPATKPPKPKVVKEGFLDDDFPDDLTRLEHIKDLGGSTGAQLVRDPIDGRLYVRKTGAGHGHLKEEVLADRMYQAMGVDVPELHHYEGGKPTKLSRFIDGRSLYEVEANDPALYRKAVKNLQKDFGADIVLGNWDVIGMKADNILVDSTGRPWRIDNGGSLRYRAMGKLKGTDGTPKWSEWPEEVWNLRNSKINSQTTKVFGGMDYFEIEKSMARATANRTEIYKSISAADFKKLGMKKRLDLVEDLVHISKTFREDDWISSYTDEFSRHSIGMRKAGIIDALPDEMKRQRKSDMSVYDKNGKEWDDLRGKNAISIKVADYMENNGGNFKFLEDWGDEQARDSWYGKPQQMKVYLANQRKGNVEKRFWWKSGYKDAKKFSDDYAVRRPVIGKKLPETFTQWHAFNYEFARNIKFENNDQKNGTIRLMRTENKNVMQLNGMKLGRKGVIKRGAVESCSIYKDVYVFGSELTVQDVPHHRILGNYFMNRKNKSYGGFFASDGENEFVAMLDGLTSDYIKSQW